jgi:hypothetical protein
MMAANLVTESPSLRGTPGREHMHDCQEKASIPEKEPRLEIPAYDSNSDALSLLPETVLFLRLSGVFSGSR